MSKVVLHAYTVDVNGNIVATPVLGIASGDGKTVKLSTDATLNVGDIQIGATENKDSNSTTRQSIKADGVALDADAAHNGAGLIAVKEGTTSRTVEGNADGAMRTAKFNRGTIKTSQKNVTATGTAEQLPAQAVPDGFKLVIKAKKANTDNIFVGGTKTDAENAALNYILEPNESISLAVINFDDVWIDAAVNGEGVELIVEI